jgi:hypothetical protein
MLNVYLLSLIVASFQGVTRLPPVASYLSVFLSFEDSLADVSSSSECRSNFLVKSESENMALADRLRVLPFAAFLSYLSSALAYIFCSRLIH